MIEVISVHKADQLLNLIGIAFAVFGFGMIGLLGYAGANPRRSLGPPFAKVSVGLVIVFGILVAYDALLNPIEAVELRQEQVTLRYSRGDDIIFTRGDIQFMVITHKIPPKSGPSTIRLDSAIGKRYFIAVARSESRALAEKIALRLGLTETGTQSNRWVK